MRDKLICYAFNFTGRSKSDTPKQVIFSDGIRPGTEPTDRDVTTESRISSLRRHTRVTKRASTPPGKQVYQEISSSAKNNFFSSPCFGDIALVTLTLMLVLSISICNFTR